MKRVLLAIIFLLFMVANVWATAGSCTQTRHKYKGGMVVVKLVCTGDSTNGSLPTQTVSSANMAEIQGSHYLYQVIAYPTSGGTAPDAADITVLQNTEDLLGGKGTNLLHATNTLNSHPYNSTMTAYYYPAIINTITVAVANQSTNSANWTMELVFVKEI